MRTFLNFLYTMLVLWVLIYNVDLKYAISLYEIGVWFTGILGVFFFLNERLFSYMGRKAIQGETTAEFKPGLGGFKDNRTWYERNINLDAKEWIQAIVIIIVGF